jgi:eukaryotic-like serine/threonine-protein kinase
MQPVGLTDFVADLSAEPRKCDQCGSVAKLANGACLICLLRPALEGAGIGSDQFAAVLSEINCRDSDWRLGNYQILEEIGRGGMGVIYRARQRHSRRIVAVKRLISIHTDARETLERFRREAEAAASLDHPHILPIYEGADGEDGLPFFSMKYARGGSLRSAAASLGGSPRECVQLMAKVARAIQHAHERGIVHCDLKPGNILLDGHGEPLVSDFGLAKWLEPSTDPALSLSIIGTPGYIAPEQVGKAGGEITPAADIYSLGAILFDLLAGRPPFIGDTAQSVIQEAAENPAPKLRSIAPSVDRDLETICARCLEREPNARYPTAGRLARDLEDWIDGRPITGRGFRVPVRMWRWSKRNPVLAGALTAAVIFASTAGFLLFSRRAAPQTTEFDKSIAVLPFEDLSQDKANTYFAAGIQGELLAKLSAVRELKVISRNSSAKYESRPKDVTAVAQELGVATILEGAVQRANNKVRISVQLIDARTTRQLWATSYDRELKDVFAVQTDVAEEIAEALKANLSPGEVYGLANAQTKDTEAYDLFLRAEYEFHQAESSQIPADFDRADGFYRQALARDPNFVGAAAGFVYSRLTRHWFVTRLTTEELAEVKSVIDHALAVAPDSPEAHFALGTFYYYGRRAYSEAVSEFNRTLQLQPNHAAARQFRGWVCRRRAEWERCIADAQRAAELDPRDFSIALNLGITYGLLREWENARKAELQALAIDPHNVITAMMLAMTELNSNGNVKSARRAFDQIPPDLRTSSLSVHGDVADIIGSRVYLDVIERNFSTAFESLQKEASNGDRSQLLAARGTLSLLAGDDKAARSAAEEALPLLESKLKEDAEDTFTMVELAWVYLAIGRNDDALRLAHKAADVVPVRIDTVSGPLFETGLAQIQARAGAPEEAIKTLRHLMSIPAGQWISLVRLKIDPVWDPLRSRSDFRELLAGGELIGPNH